MPAAAQLVYTNVEQERSPHRRRGVQVWLWTDSLPDPVRDEVEQRVNTFARPGADHFVRRIFTPLASGPFVMLAEAVPLTKPDKFGRGGRFHTHALLFDREAFARTGGDPFAFFDSGFAFQRDPDAVPDEVWKTARLPEVDLSPVEPHTHVVPAAFAPVVSELLAWLLSGEPTGTVALPMGVADVEAVARCVMKLLPPAARLRMSFDTLWTGKGKHVPRVCGAGSPAMVQAWTFRQFVRFDLSRKAIQPPLAVPSSWAKPLAAWWAGHPELTGDDRASALALAEWVHGTDPLPPPATEAAAEWAGKLPTAAVRWEAAKRAAVERAFPPLIAALPGVADKAIDHYGEWGADGITRVNGRLPSAGCFRWVSDVLFGGHPLDEDTAKAVLGWWGNDTSPDGRKLSLAASRWIPSHLSYVCEMLGTLNPFRPWFRDYCRRTLPPEYRHPDTAIRATLNALSADSAPPAEAEIAELLVDGHPWTLETADRLQLLLRVGGRLGGKPEHFLRDRPHLAEWAGEHMLAGGPAVMRFVSMQLPKHTSEYWGRFFSTDMKNPLALFGVKVPTSAGPLAQLLARQLGEKFLARMGPRFDRNRYTSADEPTAVEKQPSWKECQTALKKAQEVKLVAAVRAASDDVFRKLANDSLLTCVSGKWVCDTLWDDGGLFAGVAVWLSDPNAGEHVKPLLFALAGSVVPVSAAAAEDLPDPDDALLHRFAWLLIRLLDTAHTTRLGMLPARPSDTK